MGVKAPHKFAPYLRHMGALLGKGSTAEQIDTVVTKLQMAGTVHVAGDLAQLYEVETRVFNQMVKRNLRRFPPDFMFQLTDEEFKNLISQSVTSRWGGRRKLPLPSPSTVPSWPPACSTLT